MDPSRLIDLLEENKQKNFVQRILNPTMYPPIKNQDGSISTHRMAWGSTTGRDGKERYVVFPTIHLDGNQLKDYGNGAFQHAIKTGEFIEFDNQNDAEDFSKQYKEYWKTTPVRMAE